LLSGASGRFADVNANRRSFEHSAHALALEEAENFQDLVAEFVLGSAR
jgi:hypothetical protein